MSEEAIGRFSHIACAAKTDVGLKRSNNEDAFGTFPAAGVYCVADGMGGGDDGEIASAAVVKAIGDAVAKCPVAEEGGYAGGDVVSLLCDGLSGASDWIYRRAVEKRLNGCGSTFVGVVFDATAPAKATAVHAGDSRLYRIRGKKIVQITRDHSAAELLGEKDERKLNPVFRSMVMNAVGVKPKVEAELTPFEVAEGDRVLLCSDGLSRMVPDKEIAAVSHAHAEPDEAVEALIAAALKAGGVDNVTAVLLQVGPLPTPAPALQLPRLSDEGESTTSGSDGATCPTLAPPPVDPISADEAAVGASAAGAEGPAESEGTGASGAQSGGGSPREARHPPKGLIMVAVVFGTLATLALVFSLMRGEEPSPGVRAVADAVAPAVKKGAQPRKADRIPADGASGKDVRREPVREEVRREVKKSVKSVTNEVAGVPTAVKPMTNAVADKAPSAAVAVAPASASPQTAAAENKPRPEQKPRVKAERSPGAAAFVKACEGKAVGEFVDALRRLCPQGRLLKEVGVFSKSGASLSVSGNERLLTRAAVDLHWALKAVDAASPNWTSRFSAGDALHGVVADWRTVRDSERLDDGTPDDAAFAASARLVTKLPALAEARGADGRSGR